MTRKDKDALRRALVAARALDAQTAQAVETNLKTSTWQEAAEYAAYHCQMKVLRLRPWMTPPTLSDDEVDPEGPLRRHGAEEVGLRQAHAGARASSSFEPDPLAAIAAGGGEGGGESCCRTRIRKAPAARHRGKDPRSLRWATIRCRVTQWGPSMSPIPVTSRSISRSPTPLLRRVPLTAISSSPACTRNYGANQSATAPLAAPYASCKRGSLILNPIGTLTAGHERAPT